MRTGRLTLRLILLAVVVVLALAPTAALALSFPIDCPVDQTLPECLGWL